MLRTCALLASAVLLTGCTGASPTGSASPQNPASPQGSASPGPSAGAGQVPTAPPASGRVCGSPTDHVYHVYRLHLLDPCRTVTGVIVGVRSENDGDYHVRLMLDPQFTSMLRPANYTYQHGDLVMEPICQHYVTQADAVGPCSGGVAQIPIPPIGTHVFATGAYVLDEDHSGWAELHPLFEIHPG